MAKPQNRARGKTGGAAEVVWRDHLRVETTSGRRVQSDDIVPDLNFQCGGKKTRISLEGHPIRAAERAAARHFCICNVSECLAYVEIRLVTVFAPSVVETEVDVTFSHYPVPRRFSAVVRRPWLPGTVDAYHLVIVSFFAKVDRYRF